MDNPGLARLPPPAYVLAMSAEHEQHSELDGYRDDLEITFDSSLKRSSFSPPGSGRLMHIRFGCGRQRMVVVGTPDDARAGRVAWCLKLGPQRVPVCEVKVGAELPPPALANYGVGPGEARLIKRSGRPGIKIGYGPVVRWAKE